ncbi:hypothetical protein HGB25_03695 [Candidatus Saccharibacteria bacterium]|nr:hypothetical protein [Candidatus Saccharibacteria bacterium]
MYQKNKSKLGTILSLALCALLISLAVLFVLNRQYIVDQITVWQFKPSTEVVSLVDRAGMNDEGKFLYLASQPKLDATSDFNKECDRVEKTTSILGCYNNLKIYIYNVTDPQVDGVREVTAAHETLHAVYLRMNQSDKTKVDKLLESEYKKLSVNKDFADLIAFYDRTEPGQRYNELHSIVGTEVASISPELESHYKAYFSDRQKVVALSVKYISVFKANKARADDLFAQYNTLGTSISAKTSQYNSDVQTLNGDIASFNARAANGSFDSTAQFNRERNALINRSSTLEAVRASLADDIARYKQIYSDYNQIATESKKLYSLLDSTLAPSPSL